MNRRHWSLTILVVATFVVVAACSDAGGGTTVAGGETTVAPETTAPTETTAPPETTAPTETSPPDSTTAPEGESETPWWILLVVGGALILIIVAVARSGRRKTVAVATAVPGWKERARAGYASARWLYDRLDEDLAIWRGNAQFEGVTEVGASAETAHAETWSQLGSRMNGATEELYALEAGAPDQRTAEVARSVVDGLNVLRSSVDARAQARFNFRSVESAPTATEADAPDGAAEAEGVTDPVAAARDRELRAAENLSTARTSLASALTNLSAVA